MNVLEGKINYAVHKNVTALAGDAGLSDVLPGNT